MHVLSRAHDRVLRAREAARFPLLRRLIRRYGSLLYRPPWPLSPRSAHAADARRGTRRDHSLHADWPCATRTGHPLDPCLLATGQRTGGRLFGPFQDRLVVELRLAQARTLANAQQVLERFLPRYNARFAQPPAHLDPAWRPAPADLDRICCFKYRRTVGHDNTIQLNSTLLQRRPGPHACSYAGAGVDVHAHLNGTLAVYCRGPRLSAKRLPLGHRPARRTPPMTARCRAPSNARRSPLSTRGDKPYSHRPSGGN